MNIAFFCDAYKPTRSGVAVSVVSTAEELRRRGHRVTIFAPHYKGYDDPQDDAVRFPAGHWFRAKDFPVAYPLLPHLSLRAEVRFLREKFDVVHSHSPFTLGTLGAHWAGSNQLPLVFTFHTLYHRYLHYVPLPPDVTRSYIVWKVRRYCLWCDHIVAPSRPVAQIVGHLAPDVPCSVIPTGIRIERFQGTGRVAIRARYGIQDDEIVLLYVGRLVVEKNLVFLLRALAPLLREKAAGSQRVRLMLVGGGPDMASLQDLARQYNIAARVIFTDFVNPASVADYFAAGDIFTFASRTETQGVSIAEALASALPCVVVGAMGAAEALTDGQEGFVVPPRDAAFRNAVARVVDDATLRDAMSHNARRRAVNLSLENSVSRLLELYENLRMMPRRVAWGSAAQNDPQNDGEAAPKRVAADSF